jgi:hypothetical protein
MGAIGLPELLMLVLGLGALVVESAGAALLVDLIRNPGSIEPRSASSPHPAAQPPTIDGSTRRPERLVIAGLVGLLIMVGLATIATCLALSSPR